MLTAASFAADNRGVEFHSLPQRTTLLELYTSEGCSSCPPAEAWLSRLTDSPQLWRDFVPVAFHVDYWDHLGWRDPWGAKRFSNRQRNYAASWNSDSIYTPGFVLNGKEWSGWGRSDVPKGAVSSVGVLDASSTDTNNWLVRFTPATAGKTDYEVHAVWLASDVKSDVKAGENRGRTLKHDFAALTFTEVPMKRRDDGFECRFLLPVPAQKPSGRLAIAVWVAELGRLEPIQATGGWLTESPVKH